MSAFERLHPAVQYHIVNSLGWSSLRATQLEAIEPILSGRNCLLLAPTAGGKTEGAVFPVLSRLLTERWSGLSVLYLCPIKALLNNLESRLSQYLGLVGRRVGVWHGDIAASVKRRLLADPPDLLLTTPESLEGMLISRKVESVPLLGGIRAVLVDELHAFAGDDRGWHLRALLIRLRALGQCHRQIIGLSATVGNPEALIRWLTLDPAAVCVGTSTASREADVEIDYVASTDNAALVISRLHSGEKRLVFCDSRSRVEQITQELRRLGTRVFVSHSSLSVDARRQAEAAFAEERDCVIVATSTLELGIDVGDLDRVIQIDAPGSVSSFLQRMGRTGRRAESRRNCLFLTTEPEALLLAAAMTRLWQEGFVENVAAPAAPWHVALQQMLALVLEHGAMTAYELIARVAEAFPELERGQLEGLVRHLESVDVLCRLDGLLQFGREGERQFGRRHFIDLTSVFVSSPDILVLQGRTEVGYVSPLALIPEGTDSVTLSLAGQAWRLTSVDWRRRQAWVEPAEAAGTTRWGSGGRPLGYALIQAVRRVLHDGTVGCRLSRRAEACLNAQRERFAFLGGLDRLVVAEDGRRARLWTFAGLRANFALRSLLVAQGIGAAKCDDFGITVPSSSLSDLAAGFKRLAEMLGSEGRGRGGIDVAAADEVKFGDALPIELKQEMAVSRWFNLEAARAVCSMPLVPVGDGGDDGGRGWSR